MHHILLIDDDQDICELIAEILEVNNYKISLQHNGLDGLKKALSEPFDLIILDVNLPGMDGLEVLRKLRLKLDTPVIMLSEKQDLIDRVLGLELGSDDYLPKPFDTRELLARIKAILRRNFNHSDQIPQPADIIIDDLMLNLDLKEVYISDKPVSLTSVEFETLHLLIQKAGHLVKREEITNKILERQLTEYDRAVDVHLSNLRKKLGSQSNGKPRIKTIRGEGYCYIKD